MNSSTENERPDKNNTGISLELGDIIELISPANDTLHENSFYIKYICWSNIYAVCKYYF